MNILKLFEIDENSYEFDYDLENIVVAKFNKLLESGKFAKLYITEYLIHFKSMARTLPAPYCGVNEDFVLYARIHEDYFKWINFFIAVFPNGNFVIGDFESTVIASNKKTFDKFLSKVEYEEWDYWDI